MVLGILISLVSWASAHRCTIARRSDQELYIVITIKYTLSRVHISLACSSSRNVNSGQDINYLRQTAVFVSELFGIWTATCGCSRSAFISLPSHSRLSSSMPARPGPQSQEGYPSSSNSLETQQNDPFNSANQRRYYDNESDHVEYVPRDFRETQGSDSNHVNDYYEYREG